MAAPADPENNYRWNDRDGDLGEAYDWHADSEDDPIEQPMAALRVGEEGIDTDDWSTVLLAKDEAVGLIAWLTEFYRLPHP